MSSEQSVFSFELNETLYFEKGQEVAELRSIALEPEISIQTFEDYISIKGVIELQGEYEKMNTILEEEQIDNLENFDAKRYVDKVEDIGDSLVKFIHEFPVEISVPTYRVANLEEVKVGVESFDYELPEEGQLKLYSTIGIHGIDQESVPSRFDDSYDDSLETQDIENRNEEENIGMETEEVEDVLEREMEESFEFEIKEKEEESKTEIDVLSDFPTTPSISSDEEESNDKNRFILKTKSQSLSEFFQTEAEDKSDDDIDDGDEMYDDIDDIDVTEDEIDRDSSKENIHYLSDMFRNSDESEYTKMRLCIVQKEDTIEKIAERFEVSPLQLIKQNRLEEDFDVTEGQLLYIPFKKS